MHIDNLEVGDFIIDPEDKEIREISSVHGNGDVFLQDGGVIGADEIKCVYLSQEEADNELLRIADNAAFCK